MLSFVLFMCIIGLNVKNIDTVTTEEAMYAYEIFQEKFFKSNVNSKISNKAKLNFENNLDLMSIIPKQYQDINKFGDININVYEVPQDVSMKPCKYRNKCFNCQLNSIFN